MIIYISKDLIVDIIVPMNTTSGVVWYIPRKSSNYIKIGLVETVCYVTGKYLNIEVVK